MLINGNKESEKFFGKDWHDKLIVEDDVHIIHFDFSKAFIPYLIIVY